MTSRQDRTVRRIGTALALISGLAWTYSTSLAAGSGDDRDDWPADVFAPAVETPTAMTELAVYPPEIQLTGARDRQSIVVQATYADGITRDVTNDTKLTLAD